MKKLKTFIVSLLLVVTPLSSLLLGHVAYAATTIAGETFSGDTTVANQWLSGGSGTGGWGACLTAATSPPASSIPACVGGRVDDPGSGALRLTTNANNQSGYAIYNTPISAGEGLDVQFDMFQYKGTGADGIVFFLIDGSKNPTQAGAVGGSLGYSNNIDSGETGIVGGYVGVGFDRYGNFSNNHFGTGGTGRLANSIGVRGSEATGYQFVTNKSASGQLAVEGGSATRNASKRHVRVTVSTGNIMNVAVNYFDGQGLKTEITNVTLNTINGAGSLPPNFKFGFSAGTGGSNNIHEISGLTVNPLHPNLIAHAGVQGTLIQGEQGTILAYATNDAGAESTKGTITLTDTLPNKLEVISASGTGWNCVVNGQTVTCTRPGDSSNALQPGQNTPNVAIRVKVAQNANAVSGETHTVTVDTADSMFGLNSYVATASIATQSDTDGILGSIEDGAPKSGDANNDGTNDSLQTGVTSFVNGQTGKYAVLESTTCADNTNVSMKSESDTGAQDDKYSYPAGLMDFTLNCASPGDTATVTQYYFGTFDPTKYVMRKYNPTTHTYQTITGATLSLVTIGGETALKAVYQITDGGSLDADGVADGHIVDPAGPALNGDTGTLANTGVDIAFVLFAASSVLIAAITLMRIRKPED